MRLDSLLAGLVLTHHERGQHEFPLRLLTVVCDL